MRIRLLAITTGSALSLAAASSVAQELHILEFPPGATSCQVAAVSRDGNWAVGWWRTSPSIPENAVRWPIAGGHEDVSDSIGSGNQRARAVSDGGGSMVIEYRVGQPMSAVLYTSPTQVLSLPLPAGAENFEPTCISADGRIVGGLTGGTYTINSAYTWTAESGFTLWSPPSGFATAAVFAMNASGTVVVGNGYQPVEDQAIRGYYRAIRWREVGQPEVLGTYPGVTSYYAACVSDDGNTVGGSAVIDGKLTAVYWDAESQIHVMGTLCGLPRSRVMACSADGSIMVGFAEGSGVVPASGFLWTLATGMVDLRDLGVEFPPDWEWIQATGISADGRSIVGNGSPGLDLAVAWRLEFDGPPASFRRCPADFNSDWAVDGDDVIAFFAAWDSGLASADVNCDGGVDGDDVITFVSRWDAGC